MGTLIAREVASGVEQQVSLRRSVWICSGPDRRGLIGSGQELALRSSERLGDCPVSLRGYFIMQRTATLLLLQAKPRLSLSVWTLESMQTPSRPALPIGMAVHSCTHLPATPSALRRWGANGIRRPGFPPQLIHPIKTIYPKSKPSLSWREPGCPFLVQLDCGPIYPDAAFPIVRLFVTLTTSQTSACSALTS
jgi:hypothetical protein